MICPKMVRHVVDSTEHNRQAIAARIFSKILVGHRRVFLQPLSLGAEGLSHLTGTPLIPRRHGRQPKAGETLNGRKVRHLCPAPFCVCPNNSDTNFILRHASTSLNAI
jgi:hypothetical protein